jgi:1-deoxy-D-xylulose-5-phosphate reductoisomerase
MTLKTDTLKKRIAILGSTGSIGKQALEVIAAHPDSFEVEVITAQNNAALLIEQAKKYKPNAVVISNDAHYDLVKGALSSEDIKVYAGDAPADRRRFSESLGARDAADR